MIGHAFLVFVDFHRFFSRIMTISIHMNVPEWGSAVYCFVPVHNIAEYNNQIKSKNFSRKKTKMKKKAAETKNEAKQRANAFFKLTCIWR